MKKYMSDYRNLTKNPFESDDFGDSTSNRGDSLVSYSDDDSRSISSSSNSSSNWKQLLKEKALSAKESTSVALTKAKEKGGVLTDKIRQSEFLDKAKSTTTAVVGKTKDGFSNLAERAREKKAEILDKQQSRKPSSKRIHRKEWGLGRTFWGII